MPNRPTTLILFLTAVSGFCGYAPNPFYDSLPDKSWNQIPGTVMADVASRLIYQGNPGYNFGIYAYSGAVKDTMNGRVIFWGGGHADYNGNEVYQFNLDSLKWLRVTEPSPYCLTECGLDRVHRFTDGTPKSRHTYDQMCYLYHQDRFWAHGGAVCSPAGGAIKDLWTLDLASKTWTDLDSDLVYSWNSNVGLSCEYDPVTKRVYYFKDGSVGVYNPDSNSWSNIATPSVVYDIERSSVLAPRMRKIVTYAGNKFVNIFNIDAKTVQVPVVPDSVPATRAPGWAFDSQNELFLAYGGYNNTSTAVWYYDVETNQWFSENIPGAPVNSSFTYERFVYDDINQVTLLFRSPFENVWVLKNRNLTSALEKTKVGHRPELSVSPNPCPLPAAISIKTAIGTVVGIYDIKGGLVREYKMGEKAGNILWDGKNREGKEMVTGLYFCRVKCGSRVISRLITLL